MTGIPRELAVAARLGGEMGRLFAATDWDDHPLGPPAQWAPEVRTAVAMALASRFPTVLWLGPDLRLVYNDAYLPVLSDRHPGSFGAAGREVWADIWDVIGPMLEGVVRTGEATWADDLSLMLVSGVGVGAGDRGQRRAAGPAPAGAAPALRRERPGPADGLGRGHPLGDPAHPDRQAGRVQPVPAQPVG